MSDLLGPWAHLLKRAADTAKVLPHSVLDYQHRARRQDKHLKKSEDEGANDLAINWWLANGHAEPCENQLLIQWHLSAVSVGIGREQWARTRVPILGMTV